MHDRLTSAAIKLQHLWRRKFSKRTTACFMNKYFTNGATKEHTLSISFEALVVHLREKPVIGLAKAALQRIHLLSTFRHGSPSKALSPENVNVRVFLAGFMIAYRPTFVFESMGRLEQPLYEKAIVLLALFEKIGRSVQEHGSFAEVPFELTKNFPTALFEYLKAFKAWKVPDEAKLTLRIKHALIALYQAKEHLPPDEPEDSKLKVEFRTQIERLRGKLQQIAGIDALNEFDANLANGAGPTDGTNTNTNAYAALPGRMTNEQLAHELLYDTTFQLDESGGCSIENPVFHRIRESFHQAFWDSLVDDMKLASPCYVRVLRVLSEIRDGISDLAGSRESGSIAEAMDLDFIKDQSEKGLYGWDSCKNLIAAIVAVIQKVQAPRRDSETKEKWESVRKTMEETDDEPRAFCCALEFLLDRVNAMRIDAANARLRLIAPIIKDHGIDYERGKMKDKLNDGTLTLERTKAWIELAVKAGSSIDDLVEGKVAAYIGTYTDAMLSIITQPGSITAEHVPETLMMDVSRINALRRDFDFVTSATTAVLAVQSYAKPTEECMTRVTKVFLDDTRMDDAIDRIDTELAQVVIGEDVRLKAKFAIQRMAVDNSPIKKLIEARIKKTLRDMVLTGNQTQVDTTTRIMLPRIRKVAHEMARLCNLNRKVHVSIYNKLIGEAAMALKNGA